jgi:hypothetical protein
VGYRASWLMPRCHASRQYEDVLFALDREIPGDRPLRVLEVGVENGGSLEAWLGAVAPGSTVMGMDINSECASLEYEVVTCDARDGDAVRAALAGRWFDVVFDDSGASVGAHLWPFLAAGGFLVIGGASDDDVLDAIHSLRSSSLSAWLPHEEVMRVAVYPNAVVVEKRTAQVTDYLQITSGDESNVLPLEEMFAMGIRKVVA